MRPPRMLAGMRSSPLRQTVGASLFLALLLQGSIPVGYMPGGNGSSLIKLCTGWAPDASAPTPGRKDHRGASLCAFAAATLLGGLAPAVGTAVANLSPVSVVDPPDPSCTVPRAGPPRAQIPRAPPFAHS